MRGRAGRYRLELLRVQQRVRTIDFAEQQGKRLRWIAVWDGSGQRRAPGAVAGRQCAAARCDRAHAAAGEARRDGEHQLGDQLSV